MDKENRDKTDRRIDAIHEFGRDPQNAETGRTALPPPGTPERDIVQICGWCMVNDGRLNILKIAPCQEWEAVVIYQRGKDLRMFRNGNRLYRSDGICPECRTREFPESFKTIELGKEIVLQTVVRLYLKTYADTQTHPTASQEAMVIAAARAALEMK